MMFPEFFRQTCVVMLAGSVIASMFQTCSVLAAPPQQPPNVLIIMADDCTWNELPVYGGQNAKTPNIDALAESGLTFNKAFLCSAMCQPCRAELFTGMYPVSNGCAWNHSASRPDVVSMVQQLKPAGYRVGIAGKVHVKPASVFPFEPIRGFDQSCVRSPTRPHELTGLKEFFVQDNPFCAVVALVEPHVPWVMGDRSQYPPAKLQLPPTMADTQETRIAFSRYLAEITYMDNQVGQILDLLETTGKASDTLVLFTSEQGAQFPGCKWTNWNTGVHTALIARWPGRVPSGSRTNAIVQYADVLPTLMELAGVSNKQWILDGHSFADVLLNAAETSGRTFAYGSHNNVPEGPPYPIRSVGDGRYHLIHNLTPDRLYIEKHVMGTNQKTVPDKSLYWQTWMWHSQINARTYDLVHRYMKRPEWELYDIEADPYELNNLADDPQLADVKANLKKELDAWLADEQDPGSRQDQMVTLEAARKGQHISTPDIHLRP